MVLDERLSPIGAASEAYAVDYPQPGWAEQDPRIWEQAMAPAIQAALDAAGVESNRILALGVAGQLDGCLAIDAAGRPLGPCLIWMDRRAEAESHRVPEEKLREIAGVTLDAGHMAAKILWLKRHLPAAGSARRFHQPVSYIVARLTGEHFLDHGLASTTMLYSLADRTFDPSLLEAFEVDAGALPAIADATDRAGTLTAEGAALCGLPEGLPVAVGTGDDFSTPLGAGLVNPGRVACVLGTAEVVGALDASLKIDASGLLETHSYAGDQYFIENPGWLSGGALTWLRQLLNLADFAEIDSLAEQVEPGAAGLAFLPALSGAMAPQWVATARGCFYGLTPAHDRSHFARAVLEGCAFALRDVVERLREMAVATDALLLLGGGAKSQVWAQIRADCTGLQAEIPRHRDTSPIGAALCAAVAAGLYGDLKQCAGLVGETDRVVAPNPDRRAAYDDAYSVYRRLFESLRPMYEAAAANSP